MQCLISQHVETFCDMFDDVVTQFTLTKQNVIQNILLVDYALMSWHKGPRRKLQAESFFDGVFV